MLAATVLVGSAFSFYAGKKKKKPFPGYKKETSGSYFLRHVKGPGTTVADTGGVVFVKIKFKTEHDSVFFDINALTMSPSYPMLVEAPRFPGDFLDFFGRLHAGDSASFFIQYDSLKKYYPGEFAFEELVPGIETMKYLGFSVKVDSIYSRVEVMDIKKHAEEERKKHEAMKDSLKALEPAAIGKYIAENGIKEKPDSSGLYLVEIREGEGPALRAGQVVSVTYTGRFLDGEIFDSNVDGEPFEFMIDGGQVIPGFNEGIRQMKKGGKATLIIPSWLAYAGGGGMMRPYATLVFDIEIVDVKD